MVTERIADIERAEDEIGAETLRRIGAAWPRRATVRTNMASITEEGGYDPAVADYPSRFLPFEEHPDFVAAEPEQRERVLTLAWLAYNERVVTAEEYVANPTFVKIVHGVFPGAEDPFVREVVQQAHIDETWHTYLHMIAMRRTRELRAVTAEPAHPHSVTYRELLAAQGEASGEWERDLLALVWTIVSEISVNAYLELLSRDQRIQPLHSLVTRLHSRDESAHGPVMMEVAKRLYARFDATQREMFRRVVPKALTAFVVQDYDLWPLVLRAAGFPRAVDIVEDCRTLPGNGLLVRDFTGVKRLIHELNLDLDLEDP